MLTEQNNYKKKLAKYENTEVTLADEQHEEMSAITDKIEEVGQDELEKIFVEGDSHGMGKEVREVWMTDKRQQLNQFIADQAKMVSYQIDIRMKHGSIGMYILATGKHSNQ